MMFGQGDKVQRTMLEFDQLVSQKNYRQIFNDAFRYGAAVELSPERKTTMSKIRDDMQNIERALGESSARARQSDNAGAWEVLEKTWKTYPDDPVLNQQRADTTTRASDFVKTIRDGDESPSSTY